MSLKDFYEEHENFSLRTHIDYYISPGIKSKYDLIKFYLKKIHNFQSVLEIGASGNSFLRFLNRFKQNYLLDIAFRPLKEYIKRDLGKKSILRSNKCPKYLPINSDATFLPFRDDCFSIIFAIDVLEHIKNDFLVLTEIYRVLKKKGVLFLTIPHKMSHFSIQDKLIGHFRRYDLDQIKNLLEKLNFKVINTFGVYGRLFRITDLQAVNYKAVETRIKDLRKNYISNLLFRLTWNQIISFLSFIMKLEVKYLSLTKSMNIGLIVKK